MQNLSSSETRSLLKSTSGAVAPMIGLSLFTLVIIGGMTVDFRRTQSAKSHSQNATDAAVLAAAREYILDNKSDDETRKKNAQQVADDYLQANLQATGGSFKNASIVLKFKNDGEIVGNSKATIDLVFGGLIGRSKQQVRTRSAAKAGNANSIEVILVLDNSSSMFEGGRMNMMRDAAKGFVDTLFDQAPQKDAVKVGVVPWAATVNINSEKPKSWNPGTAISTTVPLAGSRTVPTPAFEDRSKYLRKPWTYTGSYPNSQMKKDFAPVEWRGCISAAENERQVKSNGEVKKSLTDASVSGMKWPALRIAPEYHWRQWVRIEDPTYTPPPPTPTPTPTPSPTPTPAPTPTPTPTPPPGVGNQSFLNDSILNKYVSLSPAPPLLQSVAAVIPVKENGANVDGCKHIMNWGNTDPKCEISDNYRQPKKSQCLEPSSCNVMSCNDPSDEQWGFEGVRNTYLPVDMPCSDNWKKIQTGNVLACTSDPNEFEYIQDGGDACPWLPDTEYMPWDESAPIAGPNLNCPTAMLGMSGDRSQLRNKLDHMYPAPGGTQADVGLMWAYRMLSPRNAWSKMFGYETATKPKAFGNKNTKKMMVLLTDGQNDAPFHYEGYYGCTEKWDSSWPESGRGWAGNCNKSKGIDGELNNDALNNLMLDACQSIRDSGVELYTIAVDLNASEEAQGNAIKLLEKCADDGEKAFNITSGQLDATFQNIALGALRLTR